MQHRLNSACELLHDNKHSIVQMLRYTSFISDPFKDMMLLLWVSLMREREGRGCIYMYVYMYLLARHPSKRRKWTEEVVSRRLESDT